jgi:hypothetical protein
MRADGCTCPEVMLDRRATGNYAWHELCEVHGIGTEYFRTLEKLPYGYAQERNTTREEWLEVLEKEEQREAAREAAQLMEPYDTPPAVCMIHLRFIPCRKSGGHYYSSEPQDVTRVLHHHNATQGE